MLRSEMILTSAFLFFCLSVVGCSKATHEISAQGKEGVVNGAEVAHSDPFYNRVLHLLASEEFTDASGKKWVTNSHCSAGAISKRLILTAAHCVLYKDKLQRIKYASPSQTQEIKVIDAVVHWRWEMSRRSYDIAVLLLEKDLPDEVEILKLPVANEPLPEMVEAAGYGRSDGRKKPEKSGAGVLRHKRLKVKSKSPHDPKFTVEQFEGGVCQGDSGSPAMKIVDGEAIVVGVLSETAQPDSKTAEEENPDLCSFYANYTRVTDKDILAFINAASEELLLKNAVE